MKKLQTILDAILSKDIFEYILMDRSYTVLDASVGVGRYLEAQPQMGDDVLSILPELVGNEGELNKIFVKKYATLVLDTVHKNNYYLNLSIEYYDSHTALILFHNITATTLAKQNILQRSNEAALMNQRLLKMIDHQSSLLFTVNNMMEVVFVNQPYTEYFGERRPEVYRYLDAPLQDYEDLCRYLDGDERPVNIEKDVFLLKGLHIESSLLLFTLTKVTSLVR